MPRLIARTTALISLSALFLGPAFAQSPVPAAAVVAPAAPGTPAPSGPPLTLEECIALAMKKNFDLQIQGFSTEIARENVIVASSSFYPTFSGSTSRSLSRGSATSIPQNDGSVLLVSNDSNSTSFRNTIDQLIPQTNGTISLTGNVGRNSNQKRPYSSSMSLDLSQPLLARAGPKVANAALDRAKIGLSVAFISYRSRVLTVIRDTENAYYNLVAARETLRIRQLTLAYNQQLFEENRTKRTTGVATDLDVLTAEVGLANSRRAVVQAEQSVSDREDALLTLINTPNFEVRPGPVAFEAYKADPVSFATSYKLTRDNYPDTLSAEQTIKQLEIDLATAKQNRLPTLTLTASLGYSNNDTVTSSYGEVLTDLARDHGDNRKLGFTYNVPWGMRTARSQYRTAQLNLNSQKTKLEQLELSLLTQVRSAVRSVEANLVAVEISAKATELAARTYDLQKARFDAGLSTSRLVLQAQDDLETARFNELSANVTLRGAYAELQRLEGTSIARFGVQLPQ